MSAIAQLTPVQLRRAAILKEKIATLEKQLASLLGGSEKSAPAAAPKKNKKRVLSPAARARIVAAQKARWAKVRAANAKKK